MPMGWQMNLVICYLAECARKPSLRNGILSARDARADTISLAWQLDTIANKGIERLV